MPRPTTQKNICEPETSDGNSGQVVHPTHGAIADSAAQSARRTRQYGPPHHRPTEYARHQDQGLPERRLPPYAEGGQDGQKGENRSWVRRVQQKRRDKIRIG